MSEGVRTGRAGGHDMADRAAVRRGPGMNDDRTAPGRAQPQDLPDGIFEIWLEHRLRWLYGAVVAEPIPPELLRILDEKPAAPAERDNREDPSSSPA